KFPRFSLPANPYGLHFPEKEGPPRFSLQIHQPANRLRNPHQTVRPVQKIDSLFLPWNSQIRIFLAWSSSTWEQSRSRTFIKNASTCSAEYTIYEMLKYNILEIST